MYSARTSQQPSHATGAIITGSSRLAAVNVGVTGANLGADVFLCCPAFARLSDDGFAVAGDAIDSKCYNSSEFSCVLPPGQQVLSISLKHFPAMPDSKDAAVNAHEVSIADGWVMNEQVLPLSFACCGCRC